MEPFAGVMFVPSKFRDLSDFREGVGEVVEKSIGQWKIGSEGVIFREGDGLFSHSLISSSLFRIVGMN
jgi:hypothetical protein